MLVERRMPKASGRDRAVHVFACDAQRSLMVWELDQGWYSPDEKLKARISKLRRDHPGLISAPLEE
jgi:hypothetical protein